MEIPHGLLRWVAEIIASNVDVLFAVSPAVLRTARSQLTTNPTRWRTARLPETSSEQCRLQRPSSPRAPAHQEEDQHPSAPHRRRRCHSVRLDDGRRPHQRRADMLPVYKPAIGDDAMSNSRRQSIEPVVRCLVQDRHASERGSVGSHRNVSSDFAASARKRWRSCRLLKVIPSRLRDAEAATPSCCRCRRAQSTSSRAVRPSSRQAGPHEQGSNSPTSFAGGVTHITASGALFLQVATLARHSKIENLVALFFHPIQ